LEKKDQTRYVISNLSKLKEWASAR